MAQIEGLGLLYKHHVSKSWEKLGIVQKIGLKVHHHPQNPIFFWKIFLNLLRIDRFGPERLRLIISRNYRSFLINLGRNEWLKVEKIDFCQKFCWPLGVAPDRQTENLIIVSS